MDWLRTLLPPADGALPYYMLLVRATVTLHAPAPLRGHNVAWMLTDPPQLSVISIGNSLQTYITLHFSRRLYNGRFIRNERLPPASSKFNPDDSPDQLVPATHHDDPKAADQLTPLAGRLFGTWTFITCVVRCYAAYNLHLGPVYNIAIWTYVVALGHFASELFLFKTMTFGLPQFFPFMFASIALVWMPLVREHYVTGA